MYTIPNYGEGVKNNRTKESGTWKGTFVNSTYIFLWRRVVYRHCITSGEICSKVEAS